MISILTILFFILGIVIGSFLNVVLFRFNTNKTLKGRSICLSCTKQLCWYELIPLISFFALKGRCRTCQTKISRVYPAVELITGVIFLGLFLKFQDLFFFNLATFFSSFVFYASVFSILIVIAFYDLKHKIIPDSLSFAVGVLSFLGLFFFRDYVFGAHIPTKLEFLSGPMLALPLFFFWLVSKGTWMGLGDAKLVLGLGWLVGLSMALSGIVISFWSGALIGVMLILFKKFGMRSEVPFAPFLIFGFILAFLLELHIYPVFF